MPSPLSADDVRKVARLAKLRLDDEQVEAERERLASVLTFMERLQNLPLEGLKPMAHVGERRNVLRDDEPGPTLSPADVARLAPDSETYHDHQTDDDQTFIRVPKVLGDGSA